MPAQCRRAAPFDGRHNLQLPQAQLLRPALWAHQLQRARQAQLPNPRKRLPPTRWCFLVCTCIRRDGGDGDRLSWPVSGLQRFKLPAAGTHASHAASGNVCRTGPAGIHQQEPGTGQAVAGVESLSRKRSSACIGQRRATFNRCNIAVAVRVVWRFTVMHLTTDGHRISTPSYLPGRGAHLRVRD